MKTLKLTLAIWLVSMVGLNAQTFTQPVDYLSAISADSKVIGQKIWSYVSAISHSKGSRKIDKTRTDVLKAMSDASKKISKLPGYDGDTGLRDSALHYLDLSYKVFNEDFAALVNLEEIAEQSYDDMEAYMLAKDIANEKLDRAREILLHEQDKFASRHNIRIVDNDDQIDRNLKIAREVYKYYNELYLVFFKSYKQEVYMMEALNRGDIAAIEQNRGSLGAYASQGLETAASLKPYKSDRILLDALKNLLEFYVKEANDDMKIITDFLLKKENFDKIKKSFESKKNPTKEEVDQYNAGVKEINASLEKYNSTNQSLNQKRSTNLDKWNKAVDSFLDRNVPH